MAVLNQRGPTSALALLVALALFCGSLPTVVGVVSEQGPAFTLDICHPLQSLEQPATIVIAPLSQRGFRAELLVFGPAAEFVPNPPTEISVRPETPPPKTLA
jgi:hypothetical protein